MASSDWESINRKNWDERAPLHASSPDYNVKDFIIDKTYISEVVRFDVPLLGDITDKHVVHLQCHIGTDTLSLARLGAASVTGLDFSPASLLEARKLAAATPGTGGEKLSFVEASVYDALSVLPPPSSSSAAGGSSGAGAGAFDVVFTGIGALCWIPDIRAWARVVAGLLRPGGGRLFLREGHPVLWSLDDKAEEHPVIRYPYFERGGEAVEFDEAATYVQHDEHTFVHTRTAEFNHGLGEIVQALLDAGMRVTGLKEHQSVPWNAIPAQMEEIEGGEWALKSERWRVPLSYTLQAVKE